MQIWDKFRLFPLIFPTSGNWYLRIFPTPTHIHTTHPPHLFQPLSIKHQRVHGFCMGYPVYEAGAKRQLFWITYSYDGSIRSTIILCRNSSSLNVLSEHVWTDLCITWKFNQFAFFILFRAWLISQGVGVTPGKIS